MSVALVTGGAGFIGSHLCESLLSDVNTIVSVDNFNDYYDPAVKRRNIELIEKAAKKCDSEFHSIEMDIRDDKGIDEVFQIYSPDVVIHIAACAGVRPSIEQPALYYDVNINGTLNILESMRKHGTKKLLFASSSSVYGNNKKLPFSENDSVDEPISPYAATKKSGELLCHVYHSLYQINIACLRFFTVYGPRQRPDLAINKFTRLILNDEDVPVYGDGSTRRDYTYISDIISGLRAAMRWVDTELPQYGVFNLGESHTVSLSQMLRTIENVLGKKAHILRLPMQPGDVEQTYADVSKAQKMLGYIPTTSFEDGISEFVKWYLECAHDGVGSA